MSATGYLRSWWLWAEGTMVTVLWERGVRTTRAVNVVRMGLAVVVSQVNYDVFAYVFPLVWEVGTCRHMFPR